MFICLLNLSWDLAWTRKVNWSEQDSSKTLGLKTKNILKDFLELGFGLSCPEANLDSTYLKSNLAMYKFIQIVQK